MVTNSVTLFWARPRSSVFIYSEWSPVTKFVVTVMNPCIP